MDRRTGSEDLHISRGRQHPQNERSPRRRDARTNSQDIQTTPVDTRITEEMKRLLPERDGDRRTHGRSRSPKRQENKKNNRVSWHDSTDHDSSSTPRMNRRGQSPKNRRRTREESPSKGRQQLSARNGHQSPSRGRNQSPSRGRNQSPSRGRNQSPSRGTNQSQTRNGNQSPSRGRRQSPTSGRRQSPTRKRPQSPRRVRQQPTQMHSSNHNLSIQIHQPTSPHRSKRETVQHHQSSDRIVDKQKDRSGTRTKSPHKMEIKPRKNGRLKTLDARILDAETATARIAVMSIALHAIAMGSSLMVTVPLALITSRWLTVRMTCPLYVHNNIGYTVDWGNPNMMVCHAVAYLPIIILVISFSLILFHYGILHTWYTNKTPPKFALTRKYSIGTMLLVFTEAVLAWIIACALTDGFRQTCLSFELSPAPEDRPISCKYGYDDRDDTYMFQDLDTFKKLMVGMLGAWLCVIATTIIAVSSIARVCCCYLL